MLLRGRMSRTYCSRAPYMASSARPERWPPLAVLVLLLVASSTDWPLVKEPQQQQRWRLGPVLVHAAALAKHDEAGSENISTSGGGRGPSSASKSTRSAGGTGASRDGYSALCVVGKNENRYVREWVEYHKCLGFSRIYMYDHNSSVPMSRELPEHIASGFVTHIAFSPQMHVKYSEGYTSDLQRFMSTVQGQAYKDCVDRFGDRHTFLGFIDFDEFLVLYDESVRHVDELLRDYERHPGLSVYWVLLGSSGHVNRPAGGVVDSYTKCTPHNHKFNTQFKTFANTRFHPTMYSPHRATFAAPPDPATGLEPYMVDEHHRRIARGRNKNCTHTRAAVYHYVTKSLEDFRAKMTRGGGAGVTRPKYYFDLMDKYSRDKCYGAQQTQSRFCGLPPVTTSDNSGAVASGAGAAGATRGRAGTRGKAGDKG